MSDDKPVLKIARVGVEYEVLNLHTIKGDARKRHLVIWTKQELPVAQTVKVWVKMESIRLSGRVMLFRSDQDENRYSGVAEF